MSVDNPITVVIVDEEAMTRLDLREIFQGEGVVVIGETSVAQEAFNLIDTSMPDILMLGLDDQAMAIKLAEHASDLSCSTIVLSAAYDDSFKEKASSVGVDFFLTKPFRKADLVAALHACAKRSRA